MISCGLRPLLVLDLRFRCLTIKVDSAEALIIEKRARIARSNTDR